jgi:hypothetical protein
VRSDLEQENAMDNGRRECHEQQQQKRRKKKERRDSREHFGLIGLVVTGSSQIVGFNVA